jgi:hypothetical protein
MTFGALWHRIAREWILGEPPVTDIGRQIARWRRHSGSRTA